MAADQMTSGPTAAILNLPPFNSLSAQQVRGTICVWGGESLANSPAVDLGTRTFNRLGTPVNWYPRACPACTRAAAQVALGEHVGMCEQCVDDSSHCTERHALRQLAEEPRP